jgi:AcrR family transcriptional regulator
MPDPDPIQEQLIAARRSQILEAAAKVFSVKGFHRATIRDVAQAAGIADGTIYNYFANKDALLLGILDQLNQTPEREGHFAQAATMDIGEWTHQYIKRRYAAIGPEGRRLFQVVLAEALANQDLREMYSRQVVQPTYALAEDFFRQWVAEGSVRPVDPALAVRVVSALFLGVLMLQLIGDPVLDARQDELPDMMAEIILHGLKENPHD